MSKSAGPNSALDAQALANFQEYLRIPSVHPNINYGKLIYAFWSHILPSKPRNFIYFFVDIPRILLHFYLICGRPKWLPWLTLGGETADEIPLPPCLALHINNHTDLGRLFKYFASATLFYWAFPSGLVEIIINHFPLQLCLNKCQQAWAGSCGSWLWAIFHLYSNFAENVGILKCLGINQ